MGKLRDQMIEDLQLHDYARRTCKAYVDCARAFVAYHRKPPQQMGELEIRQFLMHLVERKKASAATRKMHVAAIKFLYAVTLRRPTLASDEFLRRFLLHVLPKGFVKIRHHGLMAASNVTTKLALARRLLDKAPIAGDTTSATRTARDFREILLALTGVDLRQCPRCGAFAMRRAPLDSVTASSPIAHDTS
jgi:hypothetical protein